MFSRAQRVDYGLERFHGSQGTLFTNCKPKIAHMWLSSELRGDRFLQSVFSVPRTLCDHAEAEVVGHLLRNHYFLLYTSVYLSCSSMFSFEILRWSINCGNLSANLLGSIDVPIEQSLWFFTFSLEHSREYPHKSCLGYGKIQNEGSRKRENVYCVCIRAPWNSLVQH